MQDRPLTLTEFFAPCDPALVARLTRLQGYIDRVNPEARVGLPLDLYAMRDALTHGDVAQFARLELNYYRLLISYLFSEPSLDYGAISWDGELVIPKNPHPHTGWRGIPIVTMRSLFK